MTKLEKLYSIIERSTLVALSCKELSRSGSEAELGCASASGRAGGSEAFCSKMWRFKPALFVSRSVQVGTVSRLLLQVQAKQAPSRYGGTEAHGADRKEKERQLQLQLQLQRPFSFCVVLHV